MDIPKPYSPQTLAERWSCSSEKIRLMCRNEELAWFQLGKLIRIPAAEVERYECQNIASPGTVENSPSHGESLAESIRFASRLVRQTGDSPRLAPINAFESGTARNPRS